jgi:hypothetical protein
MKNLILFSVFSVLLLSTVKIEAQNIKGGVQLGFSASQISGDQLAGYNKPGLYGGVFAYAQFSDRSAFQMEINFVQKGSHKNAHPDKGDYAKYNLNMNYIEVPLLYKYYIYDGQIALVAGLSYAQLIGDAVEKDEGGIITQYVTSPQFKAWELGVQAGIEYQFKENWTAILRTENSILPVREHSGGATYLLNMGQYHSVMILSLAYTF